MAVCTLISNFILDAAVEIRHTELTGFLLVQRVPDGFSWMVLMTDLVDRIMQAVAERQPITCLDSESELRKRVSAYIELLWSAGKRDSDELTNLGLEYLRLLLDGPNPKYSGC